MRFVVWLTVRALRRFQGAALLLAFAIAISSAAGCSMSARQVQAHAANAIAGAANSALPILLESYRQEGLNAIANASDRTTAETELAAIKERWAPVWKAWETLRVAQNAWATALEEGGDTKAALGEVRAAYCELQKVWPDELAAVPIAPAACEMSGGK